jgi:hypothetical protein
MMGGSLSAESELGEGSAFTVRLPAAEVEDYSENAAADRVGAAVHV